MKGEIFYSPGDGTLFLLRRKVTGEIADAWISRRTVSVPQEWWDERYLEGYYVETMGTASLPGFTPSEQEDIGAKLRERGWPGLGMVR